jgi:hypothetical protein
MSKTFIFFIIFVFLLVIVGFFWYWQGNIYSKETVRLEILGPSEVTLGEEVEYIVKYKNNGDFRLDDPELIFEPPEYSVQDEEILERQVLSLDKLGQAIYPGEERSFSFRVRLLGKEGEVKVARAYLSYQPKDLKARYESISSFTTRIKSVPISLDFDLPSKVESAKDFTFRLNYFSNTDYLLTNLRVQIEYPVGFEFINSSPKSLEKTDWQLPLLNKSEGGRIEVTGNISGKIGDVRIFKAKIGTWKDGEFILLKETTRGVEVTKLSIYLRQEINNNPKYVALPGDWLHYEIYFKNIGEEDLTNLFMVSQLESEALDLDTIKSDLGVNQQGDNSIVFDWRKVSQLQYLIPKQEGKVDFLIKVKDRLGNVKNPTITNKVFIGQIKEEFVTKISSKIEISQKGFFNDEVFGNSGPIPLRVGQPTTFTVMWHITNYYSDIRNARVKAVLPQGVELTGEIFPEERVSDFSFDSESREVVWAVGDVEREVGLTKPVSTIAFQVRFIPSENHKNTKPNIIGEATITGEDSWTEAIIQSTSPAINTTLPDDPTVEADLGIVL